MKAIDIELDKRSPSSCLVRLEKTYYRALVDTGADLSIIHHRVYQNMKVKSKLIPSKITLNSVSGDRLKLKGKTNIEFKIGEEKVGHNFLVVENVSRNIILGRDFCKKYGVRLYYDLERIRIGKTYVPLEDDSKIMSIVRSVKTVTLAPNTAYVMPGKTKSRDEQYVTVNSNSGILQEDPGTEIEAAVVQVRNGKVPVLVTNSTNKTIRIKKGKAIACLEIIEKDKVIASVQSDRQQRRKPEKVDNDYLAKEIKAEREFWDLAYDILKRNRDIVAKTDLDLGATSTVLANITTDHPPIKKKAYRAPLNKQKVIDDAINEMMEAGVIKRSQSPWAFPVVVVDKKDGTKRFCVDFRALNAVTKPNAYPLPRIDDILDSLGKSRYFTTLDLRSGYWQVQLDENSREKTAFTCHRGLFEFTRMPFGLAGAPSIFMQLMHIVLEGLEDIAIPYLDDIIILGKTITDHQKNIETVFARLRKHNLKIKLKKCEFFRTQTKYLGFVVNGQGIMPDPDKVSAIRAMTEPTSVREVRGFIGMCSYYRRFVPGFSDIAAPLIELTKKFSRFRWTEACQKSFDEIKEKLASASLLIYPDPSKPYTLYTDASDRGIGACLTQEMDGIERPIHFLSHKLSDTQSRWSTIEKEAYAIYYALEKLEHYLHEATFTIKTDHKPLKFLLESPQQNRKLQQWALSISGYNCTIEYIEGPLNCVADLMSRANPTAPPSTDEVADVDIKDGFYQIGAINSNQLTEKQKKAEPSNPYDFEEGPTKTLEGIQDLDMKTEQSKDQFIQDIVNQLKEGRAKETIRNSYVILEGLLYYLSTIEDEPVLRLVVPETLRDMVLRQYHDLNGHCGMDKCYEAIRRKYFMPRLYQSVVVHVGKCVTCQMRSNEKTSAPVQEMDIPPFPFAKVSMDISGPYPRSISGNQYILSFVDWYSSWPESFPLPDKTAASVTQVLIDSIFPRFGCPLELVTDNGSENVNQAMKTVCQQLGIRHIVTSFYRPQANSKVERFHRTLHDILSKKVKEDPRTWDFYLNQTLAAVRFNINDSSHQSPFFLLYNRDVILPLDNILKPRRKYHGTDHHEIALEQQHKNFVKVHRNLKRAQRKRNEYANRGTKEESFQIGDPVLYRNHRKLNKLDARWLPNYYVVEVKSPVTYVIRNQLTTHKVKTHVNHIRRAPVEWQIPENVGSNQPLRGAALVVPPETEKEIDSSDTEILEGYDDLQKHYRQERDDSSEDDDIPLAEAMRRWKRPALAESSSDETESVSIDSDHDRATSQVLDEQGNLEESDNEMDISAVQAKIKRQSKVKKLLTIISDLL